MATPDPPQRRGGRPRVGRPGGNYTKPAEGRRLRHESEHVTFIPRDGQKEALTAVAEAALGPKKRNEYLRRLFDTYLELQPRIAEAAQHEGVDELAAFRRALEDGLAAADRRVIRAARNANQEAAPPE